MSLELINNQYITYGLEEILSSWRTIFLFVDVWPILRCLYVKSSWIWISVLSLQKQISIHALKYPVIVVAATLNIEKNNS